MKLGTSAGLSVGGLVAFGTFTSLAAKIVYELDGVGIDGKTKNFEKPWAMTTVMFFGMTFCLPIAYFMEYRAKTNAAASTATANNGVSEPLLGGGANVNAMPPKTLLAELTEVALLSIPTFFDLIATVLMNIGLLSVTASVYQMLRGAEMLFAALFAVVFLKRQLNKYHYRGIACCIAGITLVGTSSLMSGEGSASHPVATSQILFGMALIVASQAVQAAQITFEDFFMADMAIPPLKIVGYEGLFGALTMTCFLLPLVQHLPGVDGQGVHEDSLDTWHMIRNNPTIARLLVLDMGALLMYNISGMCVTGHLGAVFRTVLETTRTLFVWLVDLLLFYTPLGMGKLGESWSSFSWVQLAGFMILVTGTVIYGKGDEEEVAKEITVGAYDADVALLADGSTPLVADGGGGGTSAGGWSIPQSATRPVGVAFSLKSSMNINTFGGSVPSSVSRSMRMRFVSPTAGQPQ